MYCMFSALRAHLAKTPNAAILQDEIEIANGSKKLDAQAAEMYLKQMESESENIIHAFKKQSMDAKVWLFTFNFPAANTIVVG